MNHFLLHLLSRDIAQPIHGARIEAVRYLAPLVVIQLATGKGRRFLTIVTTTPGPFAYFDGNDPLDGSGDGIFRRLRRERFGQPAAGATDRIIQLPLVDPREGTDLVIELFGSAARVRLLDGEMIIESLNIREAGSQRRATRPTLSPSFARAAREEIERAIAPGALPTARVSGLGAVTLDCFRTADGTVDLAALISFRDDVMAGTVPFQLATAGRLGAAVVVPATAVPRDLRVFGPFGSAEDACRELGREMATLCRQAIIDRLTGPLRRHLEGRQRLLAQLQTQLAEAHRYDVGRREANILAAFQSRVRPGSAETELPDLYAPGETVRIELEPAQPINEQIQRRFKRAAKLERSRDVLGQRIHGVKETIERLERECAPPTPHDTFAETVARRRAAFTEHGLGRRGAPRKPPTRAEKRYRRFDLVAPWFALVGRSDAENDEITFRVAGPEDIWMHAQAVAGSHVVVKSSGPGGNPPSRALELAAGIAAFYSKARHAGLVPVIYTRRKYVRKFRGARPGQVHCEREKTLFAEPKLPA